MIPHGPQLLKLTGINKCGKIGIDIVTLVFIFIVLCGWMYTVLLLEGPPTTVNRYTFLLLDARSTQNMISETMWRNMNVKQGL